MRALLIGGGFRGESPDAPTAAPPPAEFRPDWNRPGVRVVAMDRGHTVIQGDCLDFLECLPDAGVPLFVADPPYASGGATTTSRKATPARKYGLTQAMSFEGDARDQRSFALWMDRWLRTALRKARPDGGLLAVFTDWRQLPTVADAVQASGWVWRATLTWDKRGAGRGTLWGWRNTAEFVVIGCRGTPDREAEDWPSAKASVLRFAGARRRIHITQKPEALLADIIGQVPDGRGPVVDPFVGSGATMAAAARMGRSSIGGDLNPVFCEAAADRLHLRLTPYLDASLDTPGTIYLRERPPK